MFVDENNNVIDNFQNVIGLNDQTKGNFNIKLEIIFQTHSPEFLFY